MNHSGSKKYEAFSLRAISSPKKDDPDLATDATMTFCAGFFDRNGQYCSIRPALVHGGKKIYSFIRLSINTVQNIESSIQPKIY
jgi:hypothetical protein